MIPAVVVLDFDPVATILGIAVRWQIAAVAATILLALLVAAAIALVAERRHAAALAADPERAVAVAEAVEAALQTVRESGGPGEPTPAAEHPPEHEGIIDHPWPVSLRMDDLLFIVIAGAAGAVVGGRLGYALLYLDVYRADPSAILDLSVGSLALAGGLAAGVLTGVVVAAVLGAPVRRWMAVAVVPLLLALCLGKLAMVLGGSGQGLPSDATWATAYAGPGPWGSLAPALPSVPAQALEAATSGGALAAVLLLALLPPLRRHAAVLFAVGLGLWAVGRFAVAFTWRDPALVGDLNGDQLVTLGFAVVAALGIIGAVVSSLRVRGRATAPSGPAPAEAATEGAQMTPIDAVAATVTDEPAEGSSPVSAPPDVGPADVSDGTGEDDPGTER